MLSDSGPLPCLVNNDNEEISVGGSPYSIFPEEVWEMILGKLKNPKDLLNVGNASPELEMLLNSTKSSWLFELVLPILLLRGDIEKKEVLIARNVCKTWKTTVDNYLATHARLQPYKQGGYKASLKSSPTSPTQPFNFRGAVCKRLVSFSKYISPNHQIISNPFVGRTVRLQANWGVDRQEFYHHALDLFRRIGHHVWHLEANYDHADRRPLQFYHSVQMLLRFLPNLRSISLYGAHYWSIGEDRGNMLQAFVKTVKENPLPPLPHLVSIKLALDGIPGYFYDPFITSYGNQLEKLVINKWKTKYGSQLTNLADLDVSTVERSDYSTKDIINHLGCPEKLISFTPGLPTRGARDAMPLYLELLQPCRNIEVLQIHMWSSEWFEPFYRAEADRELPGLKYLSLFHHAKFTYEFLKFLPSLEHLCLHKVSHEHGNYMFGSRGIGTEVKRHLDFNAPPKETQLWNMLPALKRLTVINSTVAFEHNKIKRYVRKE